MTYALTHKAICVIIIEVLSKHAEPKLYTLGADEFERSRLVNLSYPTFLRICQDRDFSIFKSDRNKNMNDD